MQVYSCRIQWAFHISVFCKKKKQNWSSPKCMKTIRVILPFFAVWLIRFHYYAMACLEQMFPYLFAVCGKHYILFDFPNMPCIAHIRVIVLRCVDFSSVFAFTDWPIIFFFQTIRRGVSFTRLYFVYFLLFPIEIHFIRFVIQRLFCIRIRMLHNSR